MEKRILAHAARDGVPDGEFAAAYQRAHEILVGDTGARCVLDLTLDDQSPLDRAGMRANHQPPWQGISHRWGEVTTSTGATAALDEVAAGAVGWRVREHVAWDRLAATSGGDPEDGVKFLSFVVRPAEVSQSEFEERYRAHVAVAEEHHGGCEKYVQNVVLGPVTLPPGPSVQAISELWFSTEEDLVERLFTRHAESVRAVRVDTKGFVAFERSFSILVREHRVGG